MDCHVCALVRQPAELEPATHGLLCAADYRRTYELIMDTSRRMSHLSDSRTMAATVDRDTERWVGSRAPLDTTTITLLDRRTRALSPSDPVSPERVYRAWMYAIMDARSQELGVAAYWAHDYPMPRASFAQVATEVACMLPWLSEQDVIVRFIRHIAYTHRAVARMTRDY